LAGLNFACCVVVAVMNFRFSGVLLCHSCGGPDFSTNKDSSSTTSPPVVRKIFKSNSSRQKEVQFVCLLACLCVGRLSVADRRRFVNIFLHITNHKASNIKQYNSFSPD
jgi:hypothetical protein